MKRHTALTSTFANGFDTDGTLTQQSLSKAHREPPKRIARGVLVAIGIAAWNPKARNGSHYGIPQGRSIYLSKVDGYKQVQWGLDYIAHRYDADTCKALQHWKDKGWH